MPPVNLSVAQNAVCHLAEHIVCLQMRYIRMPMLVGNLFTTRQDGECQLCSASKQTAVSGLDDATPSWRPLWSERRWSHIMT